MPVDRTLAEDLAHRLVEIYAELEAEIARDLGRRLTAGIDRPSWAEEKLASINDLRNALQQLLRKIDRDATAATAQQVVLAFARGGDAALKEIADAGALTELQLAAIRASLPGAEAINRMVWTLTATLRGTHLRVLRWALDVYRDVIASTLPYALAGTSTRLGIAQRAYDRFLSRGVTGFTDKAGRNWALSSYVEMATRTGLAQASVEGHFDRLRTAGIELVQVSDSPQECILCRPWEGQILTRDGEAGEHTVKVEHATRDGEMLTVKVAGSVTQAIAAGLMHPNCRHSFRAYLPGITKHPLINTADPDGDKARQQQRAIEREIRRAKIEEAGALTEPARAQARQKVRAAQAKIRDHLAAHPQLKRLPYREQIGAGNIPPKITPGPAGPPAPAPDAPTVDRAGQQARSLGRRVATYTDAELDDAFNSAAENDEAELLDAVLAEMDRRAEQADPDPHAQQWARVDQLIAQGLDEKTAYAEAFGKDPEQVQRDDAIQRLRDDGNTGRGFDELARSAFRKELQRQYFDAEAATNGFLLTPAGQHANMDPLDLWRNNEAFARKWASDELKQWWDNNGRLTFDVFAAGLLSGENEQRFRTGGESWLQ